MPFTKKTNGKHQTFVYIRQIMLTGEVHGKTIVLNVPKYTLIVPSQEQVAVQDGLIGCHSTPIVTWSWHLSFLKMTNTLHDVNIVKI